MGQQAAGAGLSIGGSILGSYFGPIGAAVGGLAGGLIGSFLFGQKRNLIADTQVGNASYGNPIMILYGTARLAGTMIWQSQIKTTSAGVFGKGGAVSGGQAKYHQSAAFIFCEGPAQLTKIWLDGNLFWDATFQNGREISKHTFAIRQYFGDETQLPDPLIAGWVHDNVGVAGACPAYRGMAYLVMEGVDLSNFGGRFPQVTAAWSSTGSLGVGFLELTRLTPDVAPTHQADYGHVAADWLRGVAYSLDPTSGAIRTFSLVTGAPGNAVLPSSYLASYPTYQADLIACGQGSNLYITGTTGMGLNQNFILQLDPNSLLPNGGPPLIFTTFEGINQFSVIQVIGTTGTQDVLVYTIFLNPGPFFVGVGGANAALSLLETGSLTQMAQISAPFTTAFGAASNGCIAVVQGSQDATAGTTDVYVLNASAYAPSGVYVYRCNTTGSTISGGDLIGVIPNSAFGGSGTTSTGNTMGWYDDSDATLVIAVSALPNIIKWNPSNGAVVWSSPALGGAGSELTPATTLLRGWLGFGALNQYVVYDTATGSSNTVISTATEVLTSIAYEGATNRLLLIGTDGELHVAYLNAVTTQEIPLASIITNLAERVGMSPSMIDVSLLTQTTIGYVVKDEKSAGAAIRELCQTYQIDMVESDYTLKFVPRGQPVVATINQIDLASLDNQDQGRFWEVKEAQEQEMPLQVTVKYADPDLDYQPGSAYAKRIAAPIQTTFSMRRKSVDLPVVAVNQEARQIAESWLYTLWAERTTVETMLSSKYLWLDPGDNITVNLNSGDVYTVRIESIETGADMALKLSMASEDKTTYAASTIPGANLALVPKPVPTFATLLQFNVPLLQDSDATSGTTTRVYVAVAASSSFRGGTVYKSTDAANWTAVTAAGEAANYGSALTKLGDTPTKFCTDLVNTVRVAFAAGTTLPVSVSYNDLMNGANACLIGQEIVQFQTVTDNTDGSFTLSTLIRGQRGTDWATGMHTAGEVFVMLRVGNTVGLRLQLSEINQAEYWKIVPPGYSLSTAATNGFTYLGYDLMPYAPVQVIGIYSGSNIVLTWVRRTRIGGLLVDGSDTAPLGETSESYDVEVINPADGSVKRTFAGLASASVTYLAAQIVSDWGSAPSILWVKVYQNSSVVGRGFSHLWKLDVISGVEISDTGNAPPIAA